MKRRDFIKTTGLLSLPALVGGLPVSVLGSSPLFRNSGPFDGRILVLIRLNGGNDGLSTLIPLDQYDNLSLHRPQVLIPEASVINIKQDLGLHPAWTDIKNLWEEEKFGAIQSVAYPNQNRSHFRSTDIWMSGSEADEILQTGWMGRYLDTCHPGYPENYPNQENPDPIAITLGSFASESCQGSSANFSQVVQDPNNLSPISGGPQDTLPDNCYGLELGFVRETIEQANAYNSIISNAYNQGVNLSGKYSNGRLGQNLQTVARLINGGLQTRVYIVSLGGFDTHANQVENGDTTTGIHAGLLEEINASVCAFIEDMDSQGRSEDVIAMTFSEFGRQIRSNFSNGTDHGTAAPMFFFGSCINPVITGNNPQIPQEIDPQEGVPMQFDFRSVYGSVLEDWFKVPEEDIKAFLYEDYQKLPVLRECSVAVDEIDVTEKIKLKAFPNPAGRHISIDFELDRRARVHISIFDARGQLILSPMDKEISPGIHRIPVTLGDLPAGNYHILLRTGNGTATTYINKVR